MFILRTSIEIHLKERSSPCSVPSLAQKLVDYTQKLVARVFAVSFEKREEYGDDILLKGEQEVMGCDENSGRMKIGFVAMTGEGEVISDIVLANFDYKGTVMEEKYLDRFKELENIYRNECGEIELTCNADVVEIRAFPVFRHGSSKLHNWLPTSDGRRMEFDFDKMLFDKKSEFQRVQIAHSPQFGNTLILDGLQNLSEADLSYTEALMRRGVLDYNDSEILILGGGDGALLHELLKESPKHVIMIDIDDYVMQSCRKFMRSVCGTCLDDYKTEQYEIIVADAFEYMTKYASAGRKFDFIFSDLTDVPIIAEVATAEMQFLKKALYMALPLLKDGGHLLSHCSGRTAYSAIENLRKCLQNAPKKLEWEQHERLVPSFLEFWQFFDIRVAE